MPRKAGRQLTLAACPLNPHRSLSLRRFADKKDALINDFENYLRILKAVRDCWLGADGGGCEAFRSAREGCSGAAAQQGLAAAHPLRSAAHPMVHALLCSSDTLLRLVSVLLRLAEPTCCVLCSVPAAVPLRRRPAGIGCCGLLLCARLCQGLPGVSCLAC